MKKLFFIVYTLTFLISTTLNAQERSKSAKTGKFVTKKYATSHKSTTYTYKTKKNK